MVDIFGLKERALLTLRNSKGRLLLAEAATVDKDTFEAVLTTVRAKAYPHQV